VPLKTHLLSFVVAVGVLRAWSLDLGGCCWWCCIFHLIDAIVDKMAVVCWLLVRFPGPRCTSHKPLMLTDFSPRSWGLLGCTHVSGLPEAGSPSRWSLRGRGRDKGANHLQLVLKIHRSTKMVQVG